MPSCLVTWETLHELVCVNPLLKEGNQLARDDRFLIKIYPVDVESPSLGCSSRKRVKEGEKQRNRVVNVSPWLA